MPFKSRWQVDVPDCALPTLVFKSPTHQLSTTKPVLIDAEDPDNHYLTPEAYRLLSQRFALGLQKLGFQNGDRLLLFSGNNIYFPVVIMGTAISGGIFTGANPGYVTREVAYQLNNSGASFFLCASQSLDVGLKAAAEAGIPKDRTFYFNNSAKPDKPLHGIKHWSSVLASAEEARGLAWERLDRPGENLKTIVLNYSSGTTGVPKGVEISHRNYVFNSIIQGFLEKLKGEPPEVFAQQRWICPLPMYHALAQTYFAVTGPYLGIPTYIMPKFDFIKLMDGIQKFKVTRVTLVPPIVVAMAKHPEVKAGKWDLSSVSSVGCGAAPLGRQVCEEFEALWDKQPGGRKINLQQGYGMTEGTCTITMCDPAMYFSTSTVGELAPNYEAKIMKEDGTGEAGRNERGEVLVKGPGVMKGYWKNTEATTKTLTDDGWLMTGDVAYVDGDGLFYIVDRMKELIKVKGNQVAPAELEALLLEHPGINDVAVIGIPRDGDEVPRAYVVRKANASTSAGEIAEFLNKQVSKHKRLEGGVHFIDEIPKNPSGKILRRMLREQAAKDGKQQAKL